MRRSYAEAEREELLRSVKRGEAVPAAARRLGVSVTTAYGWTRARRPGGQPSTPTIQRAREHSRTAPTFVQLVPAMARVPSLVLHVGEVEIEVRAGFDATLLRAVVAALYGGEV